MEPRKIDAQLRDDEIAVLEPLAREFPNVDSAIAEIARLSAELTLPQGAIHVISDIHGDDKKLRHVINNAHDALHNIVDISEIARMVTFIKDINRLARQDLARESK